MKRSSLCAGIAVPLPSPVRGVAVAALVAFGVAALVRDRAQLLAVARSFATDQRIGLVLLVLSVLVPVASLGSVFWGVQAPLSPHDGAYHAEITDLLRAGQPFSDWYPPGTPSTFASARPSSNVPCAVSSHTYLFPYFP